MLSSEGPGHHDLLCEPKHVWHITVWWNMPVYSNKARKVVLLAALGSIQPDPNYRSVPFLAEYALALPFHLSEPLKADTTSPTFIRFQPIDLVGQLRNLSEGNCFEVQWIREPTRMKKGLPNIRRVALGSHCRRALERICPCTLPGSLPRIADM